jgi:hypothetical protein
MALEAMFEQDVARCSVRLTGIEIVAREPCVAPGGR